MAEQSVALVRAALKFFLYRQRDLKRDWRDCLHEQPANGIVKLTTVNMLAYRPPMFDAVTLAHVVRHPAGAVHAT